MNDVRCKFCNRLLFKADAGSGRVEVVCPDRRCRRMQTVTLEGRGEGLLRRATVTRASG